MLLTRKKHPNYTGMLQSFPGMHKITVALRLLAIVGYSLAIASYRPSSAAVFGGIPLKARIRIGVTLVRPCCSAVTIAPE